MGCSDIALIEMSLEDPLMMDCQEGAEPNVVLLKDTKIVDR